MATGAATPRPRRGWLWAAVGVCCLLALIVGFLVRASAHGGGRETLLIGMAGGLAAVLLVSEVVVALQVVQAREVARAALGALPEGFSVSGRVRIRGGGSRPAVADHVIVCPDGRAFAVVVDGSTRSPRPGDATDGLARLLPDARQAATAVQRAARAEVLPPELGVAPGDAVRPCILVARRPFRSGLRDGVLALAAADAAAALAADG